MDLVPEEELKTKGFFNLTPIVDFLFLVIALFATLAVTRSELFDSDITLAKIKEAGEPLSKMDKKPYVVNLSVGKAGNYKWITEFNEYTMDGIDAVVQELLKQEDIGVLSSNKSLTKVLLHIDKQAPWDPVAQLVYRLKTAGYLAYPVYEASP